MKIIAVAVALLLAACGRNHETVQEPAGDLKVAAPGSSYSRFEPEQERVLVFAGQNLLATRGYYDLESVPDPAGFTEYVSYQVGDVYPKLAPDHPKRYQGNDGVFSITNWGGGEQCADCLLQEPAFDQAAVALGFYMGGPVAEDGSTCTGREDCHIARIAKGDYDAQLIQFADWLKAIERPVFLRVGYEFDGPWNGYAPNQYQAAFKYVRRFLEAQGVSNVAYVFQSYGFASRETIDAYFPTADDTGPYVDWIGYSHFNTDFDKPGVEELKFAREKGLKAFIAEVTPHSGSCDTQIDVSIHGEQMRQWIDGFFGHVERNKDVVRAIAYINARWKDPSYSPMWSEQLDHNCPGYFALSNARLNDNEAMARYWGEKVSSPLFLNKEPGLYSKLKGWD